MTLSTDAQETGLTVEAASSDEAVLRRKSSDPTFTKLVTGCDDNKGDVRQVLQGQNDHTVPHGVVYLTLAKSDSVDKDILYQYPSVGNKLVAIRGTFFTINSLMYDICGEPPDSSSVSIDSKLVHVCYAREGKEVLLVAMPAHCITEYHLTRLTARIVRLLKFQYRTLHKCFADKAEVASLNNLFSSFFANHMSPSCATADRKSAPFKDRPFLQCISSPQFLRIPTSLRYCISDIISNLESADFADVSEDRYSMRRLFCTLATIVYYRGYVICSHMRDEDMACIDLYLEGSGLLQVSRDTKLSRLVVWREVHLELQRIADTRWFLLIVGKNHTLLCAILEAGGCASRAVGSQPPDPFYVERCRSILCRLGSAIGPTFLDVWLEKPLTPEMVSAESMALFQSGKSAAKATNVGPDKLSEQKATSKGLSVSRMSLGSLSSWHQVPADGSKKEATFQGETDSDTTSVSLTASGTSDDMTPILGRRRDDDDRRRSSSEGNSQDDEDAGFAKNGRSNRYLPSMLDLTSVGEALPTTSVEREHNSSPAKLTSGPRNVLLHYAYRDSPDSALFCPPKNFSVGEELTEDVLLNFQAACLNIQKTLRDQMNFLKKIGKLESKSRDPFLEHGMLFNVQSATSGSKQQQQHQRVSGPLTYWVIGRLFWLQDKEFYVCYHDSCPQMTCEMAYLIAFSNHG